MVREEILARKAKIGTLVHKATEFYDHNDLDWDSLDDSTRGYTEAWVGFRADTGFNPRLIEEKYVSTVYGMSYGMTIDREGLMRGEEAVVDIKTASVVLPWVAIQLAGYALGTPDPKDPTTTPLALFTRRRRMAVQLFPNGRYKKHDFKERGDAEIFISSLRIAYWKLGHGSALRLIED